MNLRNIMATGAVAATSIAMFALTTPALAYYNGNTDATWNNNWGNNWNNSWNNWNNTAYTMPFQNSNFYQTNYQNSLNNYVWQIQNQINQLSNDNQLPPYIRSQILAQYQAILATVSAAQNMPYWNGQLIVTNGINNATYWANLNNIPQSYLRTGCNFNTLGNRATMSIR